MHAAGVLSSFFITPGGSTKTRHGVFNIFVNFLIYKAL